MWQLSNSEMPDALTFGIVVVTSELKMEMKRGGFVRAALHQQEGSFT